MSASTLRTAALPVLLLGATALAACVDELPAPPIAPVVIAPTLVDEPDVTLRGTKQASTAIVLTNGDVLVPLDERTDWIAAVRLREGTNAFSVVARDALDRDSTAVSATIVLDDDPPTAPSLDAVPPITLKDEVTLSGTKAAGDRVEINGSVRPTGSADNTAFSIDAALSLGANVLRVATLDQAGNESEVVELHVERVEAVPFTVTAPPATVDSAALTIGGTRALGVEVLLDGAVVVAADAVGGAWSHDVVLTPGTNDLDFSGRIEFEPESRTDSRVTVFFDDAPPELVVASPLASSFVTAGTLAVNGTVADATAVVVEVCLGACVADSDFATAPVVAGAFTASIDLAARTDLDDGAFSDLVVRATDVVQRRTSIATPLLLGRAPVELPAASSVDLAAGALYVEARAYVDAAGDAQVQLDLDGPPWLAHTARISDAAAVSAASPQVIAMPGGAAAVVLEDSPAASLTAGERGLVYAEVTPAGATRAVVVQGDTGAAVGSADLALGASGTLLAFSQGDEVLFAAESAGGLAFDAPVALSDATTLAPSHVRIARLAADRVVVLWQETSDRDGTLDDDDVVARVVDEAGAPLGPIFLLSNGSADSTAPELVALDGDTLLVGWLESGAVLAGSAELADLIAGTAPTVADVSAATGGGAASGFSLAADDGRAAVCWLDDGPALVGAATPGLVVRSSSAGLAGLGAPSVLSTSVVTSAACSLDGDVLHASWISAGTMFLQPRVIP